VIALGQHLDDLAESFLMSAFHGGQLRTMKAHYRIDAGDLRVIRPLVYVRERQTRDFAAAAELPVIVDNCPGLLLQAHPARTHEGPAGPRGGPAPASVPQPAHRDGSADARCGPIR
jgi:tRNA(Ile)-lysidine synthase TilS/MesJ